jgi:hypothetical protein
MAAGSILVAVSEPAQARLGTILAGHDVAFAATCAEVSGLMAGRRFDLVILGTHFAESSVFDVLERVIGQFHCPVVCVQAVPFSHGLGKSSFDAFRSACMALGAHLVLNLVELADDGEVRALLEAQIPALVTRA